MSDPRDPVSVRRARIGAFVKVAQRVGYVALVVAIVTFAIGSASDFPGWAVAVTIGALVAATVILPVPIVLGYGIRAAEREERRPSPDR